MRILNDAYKLLTNRGLQPAVEPKTPGAKRSYLDRVLNRGSALPPPGERAPASVAPPGDPAEATAPAADAPPKKKGLLRRLLRR